MNDYAIEYVKFITKPLIFYGKSQLFLHWLRDGKAKTGGN